MSTIANTYISCIQWQSFIKNKSFNFTANFKILVEPTLYNKNYSITYCTPRDRNYSENFQTL